MSFEEKQALRRDVQQIMNRSQMMTAKELKKAATKMTAISKGLRQRVDILPAVNGRDS